MKITKRHIGLVVGILMIFGSFLFFGRKTDTYSIILLLGIGICIITYVSILFSKSSAKSKLIWTAIVVGMAFINHFTSPYLIKGSYLIYVNSKQNELSQISSILKNRQGDVTVYRDTIISKEEIFSNEESNKLKELLESTDSYMIDKSQNFIYIGLWGFLDVRHGIHYSLNEEYRKKHLKKLKSNWYY